MDAPRYQLVFQLPGTIQEDFDALLTLEDVLMNALQRSPHEVDGHDFGSGTGNVFIDTNDPAAAFSLVKEAIHLKDYPTLKVAYRSFDEDDYHLMWPENSRGQFDLIEG
jgi:hypothetical protein